MPSMPKRQFFYGVWWEGIEYPIYFKSLLAARMDAKEKAREWPGRVIHLMETQTLEYLLLPDDVQIIAPESA